jgi:hypothetical protein
MLSYLARRNSLSRRPTRDICGLRTIQELRRKGLVISERKRLTIPDMKALQKAGLFNPDYLHLRRLSRHTDEGRQEASNVRREFSDQSEP